MTAEDEDLIRQLCTRAAMMMEDAIPLALAPSPYFEGHLETLEFLERSINAANKLIAAAMALTDH